MKLIILKTDIKTKRQLNQLKPALSQNDCIARWSIDMDDVDRVLKVETKKDAPKSEMLHFVRSQGVYCEELPD
ncbi:hypothetical protein [Ekhidna sp.]|uniref:hypothetical protein n=1 Tax=Ekhidna sp. TaxID=2608089 RepID=UPI003B511E0B